MISTTLNLLKKAGAWQEEYELIISKKNGANSESPLPILEILESSGEPNVNLNNALWALRCTSEPDQARQVSQQFALFCAEDLEHYFNEKYPYDRRVHVCNQTVRKYLSGDASKAEMDAAGRGAHAACVEACKAAWSHSLKPGGGSIVEGKWVTGWAPDWTAPWAAGAATRDATWTALTTDAFDAAWGALAVSELARETAGDASNARQIAKLKELVK